MVMGCVYTRRTIYVLSFFVLSSAECLSLSYYFFLDIDILLFSLSSTRKLTSVCVLFVSLHRERVNQLFYAMRLDSHLFEKERKKEKKNAYIAIVNIYCSHNNNGKFLISPCMCCFVFLLLLLSEDRCNRVSIDIDSLEKNMYAWNIALQNNTKRQHKHR
jgi:hypothetical protein